MVHSNRFSSDSLIGAGFGTLVECDMAKATRADTYITKSTIKGRGWTDSLIAQFLKNPDKEAPNPHYEAGPPMRLYSLARVQRVEATERFQVALAAVAKGRENRKAGSARGVQTKSMRTLLVIDAIVITTPGTRRTCAPGVRELQQPAKRIRNADWRGFLERSGQSG
jgi:hypothetical protein